MPMECEHVQDICDVIPSALGCEECLKIGSPWVHLRLCRTCGHVGCCDVYRNPASSAAASAISKTRRQRGSILDAD